ncbi:hypothetical protein GGI25_004533 [Coemansia spiralis]|uniref:Phosphatidylinositol N-acetylglucosaminyltransferase subunit H conserved domain-containing protein n=2 Tax=Coemansia TaxID=4863 RepID=A0A9W8G6F5_9FUNG|nr:hypothetical protein BX070DRAFT_237252 [Coemansia spiralis]KAJ1990178.1 hypothetical protein EDC05_004234 [Coemansia umbellata]KAJ2620703.1 hypothetical protein GGI26_004781 [Coemansia sp. RSA 1358]KAJ2673966.1 hypothetical protein GGI25_004533 [Coemansia spiralis]
MRRLRRVISKQSTTQTSPLPGEGNSAWTTTNDRADDRRPAALAITPETAATAAAAIGGASSDSKESPSFLGIDRWPIIGRSSQRRREDAAASTNLPLGSSPPAQKSMHRSSQSFSMPYTPDTTPPRDWRMLREGGRHKRTSSSILPSKLPQKLSFTGGIFSSSGSNKAGQTVHDSPILAGKAQLPSIEIMPVVEQESIGFIGYPPGGMEIESGGLVLLCEQKSPDICEYTARKDSAGLRVSDILAIALISWAAHIFFGGPILLAFVPMVIYLAWTSSQVYQESLVVIRNVGVQTETVTLAGFRRVRSFELLQIQDLFIHEALQFFEYRYYMAILPRDRKDDVVIMFPQLLPRLDALLPVYNGVRQLLFSH